MHAPSPTAKSPGVADLLIRLRALIALVVLVFVFAALAPVFLKTGNLWILFKHVAVNAILAIGMTFVILSGGIDLSVGAIAGLCGMVAGYLLNRGVTLPSMGVTVFFDAWLVVVIALGTGMLLGAVNGWLVASGMKVRGSKTMSKLSPGCAPITSSR